MSRFTLLAGGLVAFAGWLLVRQPQGGRRLRRPAGKVPVSVAAAQLQQAWADHHTRA